VVVHPRPLTSLKSWRQAGKHAAIAMTVVMLAGGMAACSSNHRHVATPEPTPSQTGTRSTVAVPLAADFDLNGEYGRPLVQVRIGRDRPVWVLLDTGSVGLRVSASALSTRASSDITVSHRADRFTFKDGTYFPGTVATAVVHIGRLTTTSRLPFELVKRIGCTAGRPDCPRLRALPGTPKVSGVMGIGLYGASPGYPSNPLLRLPEPYDQSWSIHMGTDAPDGAAGGLLLNAALPARPAERLQLALNGNAQPGAPTWYDRPLLCWRIDVHKQCGATVFDTGTDDAIATGYREPGAKRNSLLPSKQLLTLYGPESSTAFWSLTTGRLADLIKCSTFDTATRP
jgi:hypothetical protein